MPRKLVPGPDYPDEKEALRPNAKSAVRYVEEGIANDPDHRVARYEYPSGIVVDYSADDLAVTYYVLADGDVVLLGVEEPRRD